MPGENGEASPGVREIIEERVDLNAPRVRTRARRSIVLAGARAAPQARFGSRALFKAPIKLQFVRI